MSKTSSKVLPATCQAILCRGNGEPLQFQTVPTPEAIPGSVVVRILAAGVDAHAAANLSGRTPGLTLPTPFIPGERAVGRIAATGSDTVSFEVGQLVILDPSLRARDDTNVQILWGLGMFGSDPRAKKLMEDSWRDGLWAEYARAPLENCFPLNEKLLLGSPTEGGLGYSLADLCSISKYAVSYGGFRGINLKAGETVIVAPATGEYSGGAVQVASAMGARVIAVGRDLEKLKAIAAVNERVKIVQLKGNFEEDLASLKEFGTIDAYMDISPVSANQSTHIRSCMMAVGSYGRVLLMGVIQKDIAIPYIMAVAKNLTIRAQYMYVKEDFQGLIKLVEAGVLKLGEEAGHQIMGEFPLEKWEEAMECAKQNNGPLKTVVFAP